MWRLGTYPVTTIVTIRFPSHEFLPANFKLAEFVFPFEKRTKTRSLDNSRFGNRPNQPAKSFSAKECVADFKSKNPSFFVY